MSAKKVTIAELKALLARIGSPASGTRPVLQARLAQDLKTPRLPIATDNMIDFLALEGTPNSLTKRKGRTRILSVDMGIKNLAFCVADVRLEVKPTIRKETPKGHMSTIAWRRIDVAWETAKKSSDPVPRDSDGEDAPDDPFHPRNLAATAYALLTRILLPYEPDIILIERQRYRSGGGAAIQEWTVRVNMLEGMLWAILESLRQTASHPKSTKKEFPSVFDVSPARVGAFWVDPEKVPRVRSKAVLGAEGEVIGMEETSVLARGKVKKLQKIKLVQSWLSGSEFSSQSSGGSKSEKQRMESIIPLMFSFSEEAEQTRLTLCSPVSRAKKPKMKIPISGNPRKFDDLADCFLQAAAWVAWEGARFKIERDGEAGVTDDIATAKSDALTKKSRKKIGSLTGKGKDLEHAESQAVSRKKSTKPRADVDIKSKIEGCDGMAKKKSRKSSLPATRGK